MRIKESEAFILRNFALAEADKIVVCQTRSFGLIRGVAKGSRRLKSKFGAALEPFTQVNISFIEKEGRELVNIQQAEIINSYFYLASREGVVAAFDYMGELAIEFAAPHQVDEKFFRMICACFAAIEALPELLFNVIRYFEIWTLKLSGFLPDIKICSRCGVRLRTEGDSIQSINVSNEVYVTLDFATHCKLCRSNYDHLLEPGLYRLLRMCLIMSPQNWAKHSTTYSEETLKLISHLTRGLIERHLEIRPRSLSQRPLGTEIKGRKV